MNISEKWRGLGWRHPLWDYIRFYSVVQRQRKAIRETWEEKLRSHVMEIDPGRDLAIPKEHAELFFAYLEGREDDFGAANSLLRTEEEAKDFCGRIGAEVSSVRTRSLDHHQSSAAMVAAVSHIAVGHCEERGLDFSIAPTRRCVWLADEKLHVTARNLDGAIPSLDSPEMVWEIKEYWGRQKVEAR